jgi:hypothetical protein
MLLLAPANASAFPHYYLQLAGFEEFKPITTTTEATFASNAELEFFYIRNSKEIDIHCHAAGRTKLYTNGTAGITKFEVSNCNVDVTECVVIPYIGEPYLTPFSEEIQWLSELSGSGSTGYLNTFHSKYEVQGVAFEVKSCEYEGLYTFSTESTLKAEIYNGITFEYVVPATPLSGTSLKGIFGLPAPKRIYGRLRVSPVIGQALHVGA